MTHALKGVRRLGIHLEKEDVLWKENNIIAMYLPNNVSFLAMENFVPKVESFQMIADKEQLVFFPEHLNHPSNYGREFTSPPKLSKFVSLQDSSELCNFKETYVQLLNGKWCFDKKLNNFLQCEAKAMLKVVIQLLEFSNSVQEALKPLAEVPHIDIFRYATLPSYAYTILQKFCLSNKHIFAIPVGKRGVPIHSASEWEFKMQQFLAFTNPQSELHGAYVSSKGSKKIGQFFVDLYDATELVVYHINGCFHHG